MNAMMRYWPKGSGPLETLPVTGSMSPGIAGPLELQNIDLPEWAQSCGVGGALLVPKEACAAGTSWADVDWWLAAFLYLECWHERVWEVDHGSIHSYSLRLRGWDARAWQYAWVNRIALFLREWVGQASRCDPSALLGPLPASEFLVTHDVDAVHKTLPIRLKQGAFGLFNLGRALWRRDLARAGECARQSWRMVFSREDWWTLDKLLKMEREFGVRGLFHFFADPRPKNPKRWLFDPAYDVGDPTLRECLDSFEEAGGRVGLHPGFDSWHQGEDIAAQREYLESVTGHPVTHCRQHWLRFGWDSTWPAQEAAGLGFDTTLMFNDRPGFRNGAAIEWHPWHAEVGQAHRLTAQPTVLMDSHFYDYQPMTTSERSLALRSWLSECQVVRGQVAVLWHPHTLTQDYGWGEGFGELLHTIEELTLCED
jgi:hypothetical protein